MLIKLFLISAFIFETTNAGKPKGHEGKNVSFSVEKVWQSYKNKNDCCECLSSPIVVDDEWKEGVQEHYDGCRQASLKFRGPSFKLADNVVNAFEIYVTKLMYFTNTNSTVLAPSSHAILESISKGNKLKSTGLIIIKEFDKVWLGLVKGFNYVVTKLSNIIGQLIDPVTEAFNNLGCTLSNYMKQFLKSESVGFRKKVDYEPVLKQWQKAMNTIALIDETVLNECDLATHELNEAITVLSLPFVYLTLGVQGINSCVQDTHYNHKCAISSNIESSSKALEYVVVEITQSVDSIEYPFTNDFKEFVKKLVNLTMFFNTSTKDILGLFEGVAKTVEDIVQNLSKNVTRKNLGTKGQTNILKGVIP